MKILGFDVSSTCIGYCLLDLDEKTNVIKLITVSYLKPLKKGSIISRIVDTRNKIKKIIENCQPDIIAIEDIIQFMKGKSTAKTIITLTTFNRMVCLLAHDYLNKEPLLFNVMSIRHGIKLNNALPKKEEIPTLVEQQLGITFPYVLDKNKKIKPESYDMADSVAVALFCALKLLKIRFPKNE